MTRYLGRATALAFALALGAGTRAASAQTLTFEWVPFEELDAIRYGGFRWSGDFRASLPLAEDPIYGMTGFQLGVKSGYWVAYSAWGYGAAPDPTYFFGALPFTFHSVWITPAWALGETITVRGWRDWLSPTPAYSESFLAGWDSPVFFEPNWVGVVKVDFFGSGGSVPAHFAPACTPETCRTLVFDDLTVDQPVPAVAPEPVSMVLLGTGLLGLGAAAARRRRKERDAEG